MLDKMPFLGPDQVAAAQQFVEKLDWQFKQESDTGGIRYRHYVPNYALEQLEFLPQFPYIAEYYGEYKHPDDFLFNGYEGDVRINPHRDGDDLDISYSWCAIVGIVDGPGDLQFYDYEDTRIISYQFHIWPGHLVIWDKQFEATRYHGGMFGDGRVTMVARWL